MSNRPLIVHALVALIALAHTGCATGVIDPEAVATNPVREREPSALPRGDARTDGPHVPSTLREPTLAMAASPNGIVLFNVENSDVVAAATTTFPVEDIAYDPWRDRWLVVEYDDGSASEVTVWRTGKSAGDRVTLLREGVIETGGYCRVAATRGGAVIFEDDGLQQRWLITGDDLGSVQHVTAAAVPSSLVVQESSLVSRLLGLVLRDTKEDPSVSWSTHEIDEQGLLSGSEAELPAWSPYLSPARMAAGKNGSIVVAQMQHPWLRLAVVDDSGQDATPAIEILESSVPMVEDMVVDQVTDTAFVLMSGTDALKAVHLQAPNESATVTVPGGVSPGSFWSFGRMMAFDERSGTLMVGNGSAVVAYRTPASPGSEPMRIRDWYGDAWRWPVVVASKGD